MSRFVGIIGIIVIFAICYLMSNNKKKISLKTVLSGFILQFLLEHNTQLNDNLQLVI